MRLPRHIILWRLPANGIGDNLFITAVAREVHRHDPKIKITVVARYEELFRNNPHIRAFGRHVARLWRSRYRDMLRKLPLPFHYYYMGYQLHRGCQHIITQMCRVVLAPDYNPDISVEIFLEDRELEEGSQIHFLQYPQYWLLSL